MKTVLRITKIRFDDDKKEGYFDVPNPLDFQPRKGDSVVYKEETYIVLYVEFDFDENVMYVVLS